MKANELRIGNLVKINNKLLIETKDEIYKVSGFSQRFNISFPDSTGVVSLDHTKSIRTYSQFNEFIEPIELTEEWLIRFGFEKRKVAGFWFDYRLEYVVIDQMECDEFSIYFSALHQTELKYVHQLQNLYFCLTGEELKIN